MSVIGLYSSTSGARRACASISEYFLGDCDGCDITRASYPVAELTVLLPFIYVRRLLVCISCILDPSPPPVQVPVAAVVG